MTQHDPPNPHQLIEHYRKLRDMSGAELARVVGTSESYVSRLQRDRVPSLELAVKIADALDFTDDDRDVFFDALHMADTPALFYRIEVERRWRDLLRDQLLADSFLRQLGSRPHFLTEWARARLSLGFFDMRRAVPQMEAVVRQSANANGELRAIVLLDMADAYAIAGRLQDSRDLACASHEICQGLLERGQSARASMGVGRALVMQQEVAYEAGNEAECWALHEKALAFLRPAEDAYGLVKSLFFLALFRFWQGQMDEAKRLTQEAIPLAEHIPLRPDLWWAWRDGFFLGTHWWRVHTEALFLDVLACSGRAHTSEFGQTLLTHRRGHGFLPWTRDFPPFSPRYAWLAGNQDIAKKERLAAEDRRFRKWVQETRKLGLQHLHTDILISHGDFLRFGASEEVRARAAYQTALKQASVHGYGLFERLAQERLARRDVGFSGRDRS